jgi:hypothetical protein
VWTSKGKYGKALSFGSSQNRVVIPDSAVLDLTTGMTLEAWVYPTATNAAWKTIILKEQTAGLVYALYQNSSDSKSSAYLFSNGAERSVMGRSALPLNVWTHLAVTFDGAQLKLYVNGTLEQTTAYAGTILTSNAALGIGGNGYWLNENFPGKIDEVRIYNQALTQSAIQTDMNTPIVR